jgi:glycosyltransferase involved in cell wall biosynthesis
VEPLISVIIPCRNGERTIGTCLASLSATVDANVEVIVVDDASTDGSVAIIESFPCTLVKMRVHAGAAAARNAGAATSRGDILFFTDADCILPRDLLNHLHARMDQIRDGTVVGGTYAPLSYERDFYGDFQSALINYAETKHSLEPDYVATHAMAISRKQFTAIGGFAAVLPILEDVEISHRMRRAGYRLVIDPDLQVSHMFRFSLRKSLLNAVRKTRYWTQYSLTNRDVLSDAGAASLEMKANGIAWLITGMIVLLACAANRPGLLSFLVILWPANIFVNRGLYRAFYRVFSLKRFFAALVYYSALYPAAMWVGAVGGASAYVLRRPGKKQLTASQ